MHRVALALRLGIAYCTREGTAKLVAVAGEMYSTTVSCAVHMAGSSMLTAGAGHTCSIRAAGEVYPAGAGEMCL